MRPRQFSGTRYLAPQAQRISIGMITPTTRLAESKGGFLAVYRAGALLQSRQFVAFRSAKGRAVSACASAKARPFVERKTTLRELVERCQHGVDLGGGVVVNESKPEEAAARLQAEQLAQFERVHVAVPGIDLSLGEVLGEDECVVARMREGDRRHALGQPGARGDAPDFELRSRGQTVKQALGQIALVGLNGIHGGAQ